MASTWSAPGAAGDQARPAAAPGVPPAPAAPAPPALVRPPVALRPLTRPDIVDGAVAVLKASPRQVLGVAAAVVVPVEILSAWLRRNQLAESGFSALYDVLRGSDSSSGGGGVDWVVLGLRSLALSLVCAAVAGLVWSWYEQRPISGAETLRRTVRRSPALVIGWAAVHATEMVGLVLLGVPAVFAMALGALTTPVIAIEGQGGLRAIGRSWRLVRPRMAPVVGACLLIGVVDAILGFALQGVALVPALFGDFDWLWIVDNIATAASALVTVPFVAAATTLLYLDVRVRTEGLDIELGARREMGGSR